MFIVTAVLAWAGHQITRFGVDFAAANERLTKIDGRLDLIEYRISRIETRRP